VGVSRDCPNFFQCPLIISETGKATNFQFCTHILSIDAIWWEQKPITNFGKSSRLLVRILEIFQGTHRLILDALRGHLCYSSAFLFIFVNLSTINIYHLITGDLNEIACFWFLVMVHYCGVVRCRNSSRRKDLSFFRFPNDADRFVFIDVCTSAGRNVFFFYSVRFLW